MILNPARGLLFAVALFALSAVRARTAWAERPSPSRRVQRSGRDLWVDDVLVGKVTDWKSEGKQIRAGFHRIEVRHPNYYSFFQGVEVPGQPSSSTRSCAN